MPIVIMRYIYNILQQTERFHTNIIIFFIIIIIIIIVVIILIIIVLLILLISIIILIIIIIVLLILIQLQLWLQNIWLRFIRVRQKFSYPLVLWTNTMLNLVVRNPRVLVQKVLLKAIGHIFYCLLSHN